MEVWPASRTAGVIPWMMRTDGIVPRGDFKLKP